jgi:ubiquinone/menaquinone biosynthesis C-methylase UbiE
MNFLKPETRFDKEAAQWDANPTRVELARAIGASIYKTIDLQPDWRVLDYGAGTGLVTLSIQPFVESIDAVDLSAGMLDMLAKKVASAGISNVATRQWDLEKEPYPVADFDLVVSSMTLHHLRNVPLVFSRLAALLKPGGWLAVADLDSEDGSFHGPTNDVFHHGFDRSQISKWLDEAGFAQVSLTNAHIMNKPEASGQMRLYGVFLATAKKHFVK